MKKHEPKNRLIRLLKLLDIGGVNMEDNYINKEMIKDWLFSYLPAEKNFEFFYNQSGKLYPINDLYEGTDYIPKNSIGANLYSDLKSINKTYHQLKETLIFTETDWFHPFMDVAIHKHPRYFPEFKHNHNFFELCYVLSGHCVQTIFDQNKPSNLFLKQGDILFIPPLLDHSINVTSNSVVVNILLRQSTFQSAFLHNLPENTSLYNFFLETIYANNKLFYFLFHTKDDMNLVDIFYEIAEEYCNNDLFSSSIINLELGIFFGKLLRHHNNSIEFSKEFSNCIERIPAILQYIETNYATCNIQDIANHFNFSTSYLSRIFKLYTGTTLIDTLQKTRLNKAAKLLEVTKLSIDEIANMVGYQDQTYFIRLCKKYLGQTPAKYRSTHQASHLESNK
jgi:AraC-type DNA-binding domain-containing proteins